VANKLLILSKWLEKDDCCRMDGSSIRRQESNASSTFLQTFW
jgi:hypothetical protein